MGGIHFNSANALLELRALVGLHFGGDLDINLLASLVLITSGVAEGRW